MGGNAALRRAVYVTDATPAAVFDYYRNALGPAWTEDDNAGTRATQWSDSATWKSKKYLLQVGIDDPAYRASTAATDPKVAGKPTLFEVEFEANPASSS